MNHAQFWGGAVAPYEIEQSLRFDGSSKLSRTPSSAGTTTTWTLSYWIKIGSLTAEQAILSATPPGGGYTATWYSAGATSRVKINQYNHPTNVYSKCPTPVYRDPSAWFHVVVVFDSTNATADDRVRFYVNGVRLTDFSDDGSSVGGTTNPSQNQTSGINNNTIHYIGSQYDGTYAFTNSYLAEMHLLDGTAVTNAEDFGELDDNGVWRPIEYTGTYGTNGFYLKFDPSATNGIGHDHSGNGNNFTATGFTTSGTGTDVMSDTPTTNWCTLNPLDKGEFGAGITLSEGNLRAVSTSSDRHVRSTFFLPTSGKWYFEATATTVNTAGYLAIGLYHATGSLTSTAIATAQGRWYAASGYGNGSSWGATYDDGDIIGIAVDMDSGKIWAAKNNTWQASGDPAAGTSPMYSDLLTAYSPDGWSPVCANWQSGNTADFNFGQRAFAYTPPTGFKALNTSNLPAPTIKDGSKNFNTLLYTGTGGTKAVSGAGFQPDFVWIKNRGRASSSHVLVDAVRGATKTLSSDSTGTEVTTNGTDDFRSFDSDGFTVGDSSNYFVNSIGDTHVAWNWKANGSGSSNTAGSITSTVSVNPSAGFSIVTWNTTSSSSYTVGHGLGVAPKLLILKKRDGGSNWFVRHGSVHTGNGALFLNSTSTGDSGSTVFDGTNPSSTLIYLNGTSTDVRGSQVCYAFAEVENYSKFGVYTGNGSTDGPFVYCGFKPAWIMYKCSTLGDSNKNWIIMDTTREPDNPHGQFLWANEGYAEYDYGDYIDFLSNGFKLKTSDANHNGSGQTWIYIAFAENPFGGSGVSPATAR